MTRRTSPTLASGGGAHADAGPVGEPERSLGRAEGSVDLGGEPVDAQRLVVDAVATQAPGSRLGCGRVARTVRRRRAPRRARRPRCSAGTAGWRPCDRDARPCARTARRRRSRPPRHRLARVDAGRRTAATTTRREVTDRRPTNRPAGARELRRWLAPRATPARPVRHRPTVASRSRSRRTHHPVGVGGRPRRTSMSAPSSAVPERRARRRRSRREGRWHSTIPTRSERCRFRQRLPLADACRHWVRCR